MTVRSGIAAGAAQDKARYPHRPTTARQAACVLGVALAATLVAAQARAQTYPDRPVRIIVPVPAGGTPDVTTRLITPGLAKLLGQQIVVDNRAGAGSLIGTELAARATPDGHTLLMSSAGPLTIVPHLVRKMPYDGLRDFAPIAVVSGGPYVLITHPTAPFRTAKELIAAARAAPGKFLYASAGNGAPNHLATELFKHTTGLDLAHVPYKGAPQGVTDVLAGQIHLNFSSIAPVLQHIRGGRLQALVTSGARRSSQLPEIPTAAETVAPGYEFISWFGLLAPAKTPRAVLAQLNEAVVRVIQGPDVRGQFASLGAEPVGSTAAEFAELLRRDYEKNGRIVQLAGIKVD